MKRQAAIRRAELVDALAIARIHIAARAEAMPWLPVVHSDEETFWWAEHVLLVENEVWVAELDGAVVGFAAVAPGWLDQLYIDPECQGIGIGRRLLDLAKERQPDELRLHAFARNARARRFYEAAGFILIGEGDGSDNEEGEPDALYRWRP